MVGGLFGDVECSMGRVEIPVAGEMFAEDGIQGLFDAHGLDVPSAQIETNHRDEAFRRVVHRCYWDQVLWVLHETGRCHYPGLSQLKGARHTDSHFVMRSSMLLGSRMNVGKVIRLKSAPGRSCEMMDKRTSS